jgi:hypothetical protein
MDLKSNILKIHVLLEDMHKFKIKIFYLFMGIVMMWY